MCSHRQEERRFLGEARASLPINDGIEPKETARRETQGAHSWSIGVVVVGGGKHLKVKCCQEGVVGHVSPINDSSIHSY